MMTSLLRMSDTVTWQSIEQENLKQIIQQGIMLVKLGEMAKDELADEINSLGGGMND